jgi:hypothetical protein
VPWETFFTYGQATVYGEGSLGELRAMTAREGCGETAAITAPAPAGACCTAE